MDARPEVRNEQEFGDPVVVECERGHEAGELDVLAVEFGVDRGVVVLGLHLGVEGVEFGGAGFDRRQTVFVPGQDLFTGEARGDQAVLVIIDTHCWMSGGSRSVAVASLGINTRNRLLWTRTDFLTAVCRPRFISSIASADRRRPCGRRIGDPAGNSRAVTGRRELGFHAGRARPEGAGRIRSRSLDGSSGSERAGASCAQRAHTFFSTIDDSSFVDSLTAAKTRTNAVEVGIENVIEISQTFDERCNLRLIGTDT